MDVRLYNLKENKLMGQSTCLRRRQTDRQKNEGGAGPQNYGEDTSGTIKITPQAVYYYDYSK